MTVGNVLTDINNATGNGGKLVASLANGGIKLTDNSGGAGSFTISDENQASVVQELGLNVAASGNTISGGSLIAGINSVLLRNLNGGQGITQTGQIQLQDRTGLTATIDLTGAQSLDQVINAINSAKTTGGQKLNLSASIDLRGRRHRSERHIGVDCQQPGRPGRRRARWLRNWVSRSMRPRVRSIRVGSISSTSTRRPVCRLTRRAAARCRPDNSRSPTPPGKAATIAVTSSDEDPRRRIATDQLGRHPGHRTAQQHGRRVCVIDNAGGTGSLSINDNGGTTAADLRIAGTGTPNGGGQSQIDSREATIINVTSSDTLNSIVQKIGQSGLVNASVVNDGSANTPNHLELAATTSGQAGQFFIDQSGINLGFQTSTPAQNALLLVGSGAAGLILSSSTNTFNNAQPGLTVQTLGVGSRQTPRRSPRTRRRSSTTSRHS